MPNSRVKTDLALLGPQMENKYGSDFITGIDELVIIYFSFVVT